MTRLNHCRECGRPYPWIYGGTALPPLKARIFDVVKAAGEIGITSRDLLAIIYEGRRKPKHLANIRCHIGQINDLLAATNWKIVTHDRRHWILTNVNPEKPAPSGAHRPAATPRRPRGHRSAAPPREDA